MNIGREPGRRNRNFEIAKQRYWQDNRLVIPESCAETRVCYERLEDPDAPAFVRVSVERME